jgi:MFS family permease
LPNIWPKSRGLPEGPAAVLAALHLSEPRTELLAGLSQREAHAALAYADRSQISLVLRGVAPEFLADELAQRAEKNRVRVRTVLDLYRWLGEVLGEPLPHGRGSLEFLALKGMTQCALSGMRLEDRAQTDVDIYLPRPSAEVACSRLKAEGYVPMEGMESFPTDHLPALIRRNTWEFRGDLFDVEMPYAIEVHFQFWNPGLERLSAPGVEKFWDRRVMRTVGHVQVAVLSPPDAIGYAALHLLKHLLQGDARPFHVYELARCLHHQATNQALWSDWQALHSPETRRLEAVVFQLARVWFGCDLPPAAREEIERLPASALFWFTEFAASPATSPFSPNKHQLWLHLSLLHSTRDRMDVASRRLVPRNLPPPVTPPHMRGTTRARILTARYWLQRLRHHGISLFTTLGSGVWWWWKTNALGPQFWIFLAAAVVFNFALFIFFLLFNLFLTDHGFAERFLGDVAGAARVGSLVGTVPAAWIAHRLGLRRSLVAAIAGTALLTLARALVVGATPVIALAFVASALFSLWAVIMAPSIAAAVEEKRRPAAFSFFFATMFANGIGANWIAGRLPDWLHGKQPALVLSAILCALSVIPALCLQPAPAAPPGARIYPRGSFLWRFLASFAIWQLATGVFNPFNNVYFARLKFSVAQIGAIFSAAQLVQVVALLLAPLVTRRLGLVTGIVWMMFATALALGGLAAAPGGTQAVTAYVAYMACQWMSEPGLNTLLMNHVGEQERGGASALNYLVAFSAQAVAAFAAGALFGEFGYGPVLVGAAAAAACAAMLFRSLA